MIFVGIDVASKKHDCFLTHEETGMIYSKPFSIENNEEGYLGKQESFNGIVFLLREPNKDENGNNVLTV